jgi:hypothetical protein
MDGFIYIMIFELFIFTGDTRMIEQICKAKKIEILAHFTDIRHLPSIMTYGLVPRYRLAQLPTQTFPNDTYRLDGHTDSISLSISFPNDKMFYKYRMNTDKTFCVLGLNASILWELDSAFCHRNAACAEISHIPIKYLKTADALNRMFQEVPELRSREEQKLKSEDPTDVQAEVLVFNTIHPRYISHVIFTNEAIATPFQTLLKDKTVRVQTASNGVFGTRTFSREY